MLMPLSSLFLIIMICIVFLRSSFALHHFLRLHSTAVVRCIAASTRRDGGGPASIGEDKYIRKLLIRDIDGKDKIVNVLDIPSQNPLSKNKDAVPTVVLLGTAQTLKTFSPHYKQFTKWSRLIIPELRCQGETELLSTHSTMLQHCKDLTLVLQALNIFKCNFVGFSFGGRVGLAMAATHPNIVERLSVTGVPLIR